MIDHKSIDILFIIIIETSSYSTDQGHLKEIVSDIEN